MTAPASAELAQRLRAPASLAPARAAAHAAVQLPGRAGRANLSPAKDGSHLSVAWSLDLSMFLTRPLGNGGESVQVGLSLDPFGLAILRDGSRAADLPLDGQTLAAATVWLDERLAAEGLAQIHAVAMPYELPDDIIAIDAFAPETPHLATLAAWYTLAQDALQALAASLAALEPGPSAVLCWPHHFDVATYISLEAGDPETAKGIGVGLSPGDESYGEPYFYVNPWPQLDPALLPEAIAPGHWHSQGFVGAIATATEILAEDDVAVTISRFLSRAVDTGQLLLRR